MTVHRLEDSLGRVAEDILGHLAEPSGTEVIYGLRLGTSSVPFVEDGLEDAEPVYAEVPSLLCYLSIQRAGQHQTISSCTGLPIAVVSSPPAFEQALTDLYRNLEFAEIANELPDVSEVGRRLLDESEGGVGPGC